MSFTLRTVLVFAGAVVVAALIAPWVAPLVSRYHFPFPRVFDRVAMAMLAAGLIWQARSLKLSARLRRGFARPAESMPKLLQGFVISLGCVVLILLVAAVVTRAPQWRQIIAVAPSGLLAALLIAVIEEAFFRAFLLDGMVEDFGSRAALIASSAVYALAHEVRSPGRLPIAPRDPIAGFKVIAAGFNNLTHPAEVLPALVGLFLLGMLLGEAFLLTRRVYLSIGLHAGFVFGAQNWRHLAPAGLPGWLIGYGHPALIGGPIAWAIAVALLVALRPLTGTSGKSSS